MITYDQPRALAPAPSRGTALCLCTMNVDFSIFINIRLTTCDTRLKNVQKNIVRKQVSGDNILIRSPCSDHYSGEYKFKLITIKTSAMYVVPFPSGKFHQSIGTILNKLEQKLRIPLGPKQTSEFPKVIQQSSTQALKNRHLGVL